MAKSADQIIIEHVRHGVIDRARLRANGVSASSIDRRIRQGLLEPMGGRVYLVPALATENSPLVAALLALPDAAVSRTSAGHLLGFAVPNTSAHVTVAHGRRLVMQGVTIHETRRWLDHDVTEIDGLRVTSPTRTIIDLAAEFSTHRLRHLVETQLIKNTPDSTELVAAFRAHRRRGLTGTAKLAAVLDELLDDQPFPDSVLEAKVWQALLDRGLSAFRRQFRPPWYDGRSGIVDFAHPEARVILEADGRRWHAVTQAQNADRSRDRRAVAAGWVVLRVGWTEIVARRSATLDEIEAIVTGRLRPEIPASGS